MKKIIAILVLAAGILPGFGQTPEEHYPDQSTPEGVAKAIFTAAKTGEFCLLVQLCSTDLDTDGDSKRICGVASANDNDRASFKTYFSTGELTGEAEIKGNEARVPFLFGPDGTKKETFTMIRKAGKWYLASF